MDPLQPNLIKCRRWILGATIGLGMVGAIVLIAVPIDETLTAAGVIVAEREQFLFAPEDGVVQQIYVEEGAQVKTGDVILTLDPREEESRRSQLQAELKEAMALAELKRTHFEKVSKLPLPKEFWHAQTELAEARERDGLTNIELERYQQLLAEGLTSHSEFDARKLTRQLAARELAKAEEKMTILSKGLEDSIIREATADLDSSMARIDRLKVELMICESGLDRRTLRATADGQVALLLKRRAGERVQKGEELVHLSQGEARCAELWVGESRVYRLRKGQQVRMKSPLFDALRFGCITGHVDGIAPEAFHPQTSQTPRSGTYFVKAKIDQSPVPLTLGATVKANIVLRRVALWRLLLPRAIEDR